MATRKATKKSTKSTKAATKAEKPAKEEAKEPTIKSIIEAGISRFVEEANVDNQKARYKAQRAIAFQAFKELVESDEFDAVIDRALENAEELPSGWTLKARPATKKTTKKAAKDEEPEEEDNLVEDEDELVEDEPETEAEDELEEDEPEEEKPAKKTVRRRRRARK